MVFHRLHNERGYSEQQSPDTTYELIGPIQATREKARWSKTRPTTDDPADGQLTLVLPFPPPGALFQAGGRIPRLTDRLSHMIGKSGTGQDAAK
jgi:hypothetical protein